MRELFPWISARRQISSHHLKCRFYGRMKWKATFESGGWNDDHEYGHGSLAADTVSSRQVSSVREYRATTSDKTPVMDSTPEEASIKVSGEGRKEKWTWAHLDWIFIYFRRETVFISSPPSSRSNYCIGVAFRKENQCKVVKEMRHRGVRLGMLSIKILTPLGYETSSDSPKITRRGPSDRGPLPLRSDDSLIKHVH